MQQKKMDITRELIARKPRQTEKQKDHFSQAEPKFRMVFMCIYVCVYMHVYMGNEIRKGVMRGESELSRVKKINGIMGYMYALVSINR